MHHNLVTGLVLASLGLFENLFLLILECKAFFKIYIFILSLAVSLTAYVISTRFNLGILLYSTYSVSRSWLYSRIFPLSAHA